MPITSLGALATAACGVITVIGKCIDLANKVRLRKRRKDEDLIQAKEILDETENIEEILTLLKNTLSYLFSILPEVAKLHAFADKLRETLVLNKKALKSKKNPNIDKDWAYVLAQFQAIDQQRNSTNNYLGRGLPIPESEEAGVLKANFEEFTRACKDASIKIGLRDSASLEESCLTMTAVAGNLKGYVERYIQDLLNSIF